MPNLHHTCGRWGGSEEVIRNGWIDGRSELTTVLSAISTGKPRFPCDSQSRLKLAMSDIVCRDRIGSA
jgi:hypothetical protein